MQIIHSLLQRIILLLLFIFTLHSADIFAQQINTVPKPSWVKEKAVPYKAIDSLGYAQPSRHGRDSDVYEEIQINVDTEEFFSKQSQRFLMKTLFKTKTQMALGVIQGLRREKQ